MAQPRLDVVIVSYNTSALLHACLSSLAVCQLPLRILVVDNASRDDSVAMVREQFPHVELIALDTNLGFAGGTNRGLCQITHLPGAPAPYLLLLNPDTVVHPDALETMVAFLEAHPRVGLVGPRLLNPDATPQAAAFRFPTLLMILFDLFPPGELLPGRLYASWWHGRYPEERSTAPFAIDHPLGACMLVRQTTLAEVGPLDDRYFMYSEEVEWCWRIRHAGWAIWQVPRALVTHVGGAATSQFRHPMFVALWQSRDRFTAQYRPIWYLLLQRVIVRAGMLRLALVAWFAYLRGTLSRQELQSRLLTYGRVSRDCRGCDVCFRDARWLSWTYRIEKAYVNQPKLLGRHPRTISRNFTLHPIVVGVTYVFGMLDSYRGLTALRRHTSISRSYLVGIHEPFPETLRCTRSTTQICIT